MPASLLPCPFCGGAAEIATFTEDDSEGAGAMIAMCKVCKASGGRLMWATGDDPSPALAEHWNRRQDGCTALRAIIRHWDEFGPDNLDELIDAARRTATPTTPIPPAGQEGGGV